MSMPTIAAVALLGVISGPALGLDVVAAQRLVTEVQPAPAEVAAPPPVAPAATAKTEAPPVLPKGVELPADYVIGVEDQLQIVVWENEKMSTPEAVVRPDGKISVPLINEIAAVGLTPDELRKNLEAAAAKFAVEPTVSVIVKAINSRKVFITGEVAKSGAYLLIGPMTVMQLITSAGGLAEWADRKKIRVARTVNGKPQSFLFNYNDFVQGKSLETNIELKPGDQVTVPGR